MLPFLKRRRKLLLFLPFAFVLCSTLVSAFAIAEGGNALFFSTTTVTIGSTNQTKYSTLTVAGANGTTTTVLTGEILKAILFNETTETVTITVNGSTTTLTETSWYTNSTTCTIFENNHTTNC